MVATLLGERTAVVVMDVLKHLVVPEEFKAAIVAEVQRLNHGAGAPAEIRDAALEARLQQLKQAYNAGILARSKYDRKVRETQTEKGHTPGGAAFNTERALILLADIPRLLREATAQERLALVKSLFERIFVKDRRITELVPRADVGPVLAALVRVLHGVPDGPSVPAVHYICPCVTLYAY